MIFLLRWLGYEQRTISQYFDRHLAAVRVVAGRRHLLTPVTTPVDDDLNDEPAASASQEIADGTGPLDQDSEDQRIYDRELTMTLTFETYTDHPAGLGIQWP